MAGSIKGITVELNGNATNLTKAINDAKRSCNAIGNELKTVDRLLKLDPGNFTLTKQKADLLAQSIQKTRDSIAQMEAAQEQVERQFAAGDIGEAQYRKFNQELVNARERLKGLESEQKAVNGVFMQIPAVKAKYAELGAEIKKSEDEVDRLKATQKEYDALLAAGKIDKGKYDELTADVKKATDEQLDHIKACRDGQRELSNLGTQFTALKGKIEGVSQALAPVAAGLQKVGSVASAGFNLGVKALTAYTAAIAGVGLATVGYASDLEEVQNVVDTTFGDEGAGRVNKFATDAAASFGLSELEAKKYSGTMGSILKSAGITGQALESMSTNVTGLAGDFASFYNMDSEEAFDKIRSGLMGETEPLKSLGINMSAANLEAFALAQGIEKSYNSMTEAEKVQLRYNYLMQASADAQGDFAKTSDSFANQQRIAALQLKTLTGQIGGQFLPVFTAAMQQVTAQLPGISEAFAAAFGGDSEAASALSTGITDMISGVATSLGENLPALLDGFNAVMSAVVEGIAAALPTVTTTLLPALIDGLVGLVSGLVDQMPTLIPALIDGAVALFTGLVEGFTEVIPKVIEVLPELITQICTAIAENAPAILDAVIALTVGIVGAIITNFPQILAAVVNGLGQILASIVQYAAQFLQPVIQFAANFAAKAKEAAGNFLQNIVQGLTNTLLNIVSFLTQMIAQAVSFASNLASNARQAASGFLSNLVSGLASALSSVVSYLAQMIGQVVSFAGNLAANAASAGQQFFSNLASGLSQAVSRAASTFGSIISSAGAFVGNMASKAAEAASGFCSSLISGLSGIVSQVTSIGSNIVQGIWSGISSGWSWLTNQVRNIAGSLLDAAKGALGIHSPSTKFRDIIGKNMAAGIGVGFVAQMKTVRRDMERAIPTNFAANISSATRTADTNAARALAGVGVQVTVINQSPKAISAAESDRLTRRTMREIVLRMGGTA